MNSIEGGQISTRQAMLLLTMTLSVTTILFLPGLAAGIAKQDSWMVPIIPTPVALTIVWFMSVLARRHPGLSLVQISEAVYGRFVGKALGAAFIFWLIHTNAVIIRELAELVKTTILMATPIEVVEGMTALVAVILVILGLEVMARTNELITVNLTIAFSIVLLLAAKDFHPERLTPVLEHGLLPVLKASVSPAAFRGEVVLLGMIMPFLEERNRVLKIGFWAVTVPLLLLVFLNAASVMMFGPEEVGRIISPTLELARTVQVAGFVERIEALVVATWIGGTFVKIAFFHYAAVLALAQVTGLSDYRPLAFPVGAVTTVLGIAIFDNILELLDYISEIWGPYGLTFEFGFPLLLVAGSLIRGTASRTGGRTAGCGPT